MTVLIATSCLFKRINFLWSQVEWQIKTNSVFITAEHFPFKLMAILRNKRKLATVIRETQEEHPGNGQSRNTCVPRINGEYIKQVSEEIEGRVTEKLSQEFSTTESRILGARSKLDEFLLNPTDTDALRNRSGNIPDHTCRKPGTKWGSFPGWSLSWSGTLRLSVPSFNWFRPKRVSSL